MTIPLAMAKPGDEVRTHRVPRGPLSGDEKIVIGKTFNWKFSLLYT